MEKTFHIGGGHAVMLGHKVFGQSLLPGLAYIDLLYQFFAEQGHSFAELELRDLSIYRPLSVSDGEEILLRIHTSKTDTGWKVGIGGRRAEEQDEVTFVTAEMRQHDSAVTFDERLEIGAVQRSAQKVVLLDDVYAQCRAQGLVHSGAMKADGRILANDSATCFEVRLPPEALADGGHYMFHPALIDGVGIGSRIWIPSEKEEEELFLPLSFESFRASDLLQSQCRARIPSTAIRCKGDLFYLDIELFNEAGAKIAELKNFIGKLAGAAELKKSPRKNGASLHATGGISMSDSGSLIEFLRDLIAKGLDRPPGEIDEDLGYYDLGMDSVMLLEMVEALRESLSIELSPTLLFEHTTIREVANYLERQHGAALRSKVQGAPESAGNAKVSEGDEIAIIGMAGRYPGAENLDEFWANLKDGKDCVTEIPSTRWDPSEYEELRSPSGKRLSRWGGFIDHPDCFDPAFFKISPREANSMDPQERQFLEVCWAAMEDAGYTPENLVTPEGRNGRRKAGVFVGVMHNDYALLGAEALARGENFPLSLNHAPIANRVSYVCDFHGPSMAIDTVCSSSLTAIHLALESIRRGECRVALAGGVNLSLHPHKYVSYGMLDMHASDGRCRSFGKGGDGYVSSEGVGAVLLKPLQQALLDKDHVYAVVKGSVINHGGRASGIAVPNPVAQADMIEECLKKAGVDPRSISYVETHGTGTSLGDPIEIEGLVRAFMQHSGETEFCSIGSLKSNIGHAESAAGVAGLTKLVLQLQHKKLVRSLHSEEINPYLTLEDSPFYIQQRTEEWRSPRGQSPRRAGLSSFGATGSNAHLIVEEFLDKESELPGSSNGPYVVPLSAKNSDRLVQVVENLRRFVAVSPLIELPELAYTLQIGRQTMDERIVFLASERDELLSKLEQLASGGGESNRDWRGSGKPVSEPENFEATVREWVARGDLERIASTWAENGCMAWSQLHEAKAPGRISLPTYPFARERYWVPGGAKLPSVQNAAKVAGDSVFYAPRWISKEYPGRTRADKSGEHVTIFVGSDDVRLLQSIEQLKIADRVIALAEAGETAATLEAQALQLFRYAKECLSKRAARNWRIFVWIPGAGYSHRSLMGILRSLALESPSIRAQLLLDATPVSGSVESALRRVELELESADPPTEVFYDRKGDRKIFALEQINPDSRFTAFKPDGVYWITGGMGGLGRLFAEHILSVEPQAHLILSGRSSLDSEKSEWLESLVGNERNVEYHRCDTCSPGNVRDLLDTILARHGRLDGLIHSAGVVHDSYLVNKTEEEIKNVLSPKVRSILVLDEEIGDRALDFFVLFSSIASFGSAGQLDYATGNAFLDAFAEHRDLQVARGARKGKTLSVNWPLWEEGGMTPGQGYEDLMLRKSGMRPLPSSVGLEAFSLALGHSGSQVGVAFGAEQKICGSLGIGSSTAVLASELQPIEDSAPLHAKIQPVVLNGIAKVFSVDRAEIDLSTTFVDHGADSVMLTELANHLNAAFGLDFAGSAFLELESGARVVEHLREKLGSVKPAESEKPQQPRDIPVAVPQVAPDFSSKVAIIGFDGTFPGATDSEEFWENIVAKHVAVRELDQGHWKQHGIELNGNRDALDRGMNWAALMSDIDEFDASFWDIGQDAAVGMDPQLRLLLKSVWHSFEHAGCAVDSLGDDRRVGVFVAADSVDYLSVLKSREHLPGLDSSLSLGMLANRLSYHFDFRGPSECFDTACSSVYVALNRAVQAIQCGQCEMAVVGAAKVLLDPSGFEVRDQGDLLSKSGRTRSFDAVADGYVRGEGVGSILLKRASQAEVDGDTIFGVVAGIDVSHNGRGGLSSVAPNVDGQHRAMQAVYSKSGIDPATVNYIEAHGTATELNDAAEMASYRRLFKNALEDGVYREHRCAISTVKPNIGHLEGASGIASLIKALQAIKFRKIPPIAGYSNPHPAIFLENGPFYVPTELEDWKARNDSPRRVALHSVGLGGVNAHLVLEEHQPDTPEVESSGTDDVDYSLLVISARSAESLKGYLRKWLEFLRSIKDGNPNQSQSWANFAYSSRVGRSAMDFRAAFVARDIHGAASDLRLAVDGVRQSSSDSSFMAVSFDSSAARADGPNPMPTSGSARSLGELSKVAETWVGGEPVRFAGEGDEKHLTRVEIPNYPFERKRYWCRDEFETLFYETFGRDN